jgi:hypothetical protein
LGTFKKLQTKVDKETKEMKRMDENIRETYFKLRAGEYEPKIIMTKEMYICGRYDNLIKNKDVSDEKIIY